MDLFQLSAGLSMDISPFKKALDDAEKAANNFTGKVDWKRIFSHPINDVADQADALVTKVVNKVDDVGDKVDEVTGKAEKTNNVFDKIQQTIKNIGDHLYDVGSNMERLGGATEKFFEPATKFGQNAIDTAIDYESAFTGVKKTVKGTAEEYDALSAGIKDLSTTTASDKIEIAGVAEVVGQLTDKIENVLPITETAIKLGDTTVMSAGDAATQLTRLMNIMGDGGEKAGSYGSALVELGNNMATDEKQILNMGLRIAGAGNQIGMTGDQVLALSAGLSSLGIRAEAGGSSISRVLLSMGEAARTGTTEMDELQEKTGMTTRELEMLMENSPSDFRKLADSIGMTNSEMKEIVKGGVHLQEFADISGMTADEFAQAMQEDAYSALLAFLGGLGQLDEEGASAYSVLQGLDLNTIRVRDSLLRGAAGYEEMTKAASMSSEAFEKNTALEDEAALRYGTTESKVHQLKETFSNLVLEVGDRLLPMVEKALGFGDKVITFLDSLPDGMLETIATIGLVGGAIGKIITSIGGVVKAGGMIISMLGSLGPTGAIIAVVIAGAALIIANWDKIKEFFGNLASWFGERIETIKGELHDWAEYFRGIGDKISTVCNAIGQFFSDAWGAASDAVNEKLDNIKSAYEEHGGGVKGVLAGMWEGIKGYYTVGWTFIDNLTNGKLSEIAGVVGDWVSARLEAIGKFFSNMQEKVKSGLEAVKNFFTNGFETIKQTITTFVTQAITKITEFVQNVKNKIEEFKNNLIEKFEKLKSDVVAKVTKIKDDAIQMFTDMKQAVIDKVETLKNDVTQFFSDLAENIRGKIQDFIDIGDKIVKGIWQGISDGYTWITEKISGWVGNVLDFFKKLLGIASPSKVFKKYGKYVVEGFDDGIEAEEGSAEKTMKSLVDTITKTMEKVVDKLDKILDQVSKLVDKLASEVSDKAQSVMRDAQSMIDAVNSANSAASALSDDRFAGADWNTRMRVLQQEASALTSGFRINYDNNTAPSWLGSGAGESSEDRIRSLGWRLPGDTAPQTAPMTTGNGMNGSAAQNDRPINITVQSVLDGRVIGETAYRYNRQRNYVLGRANA